MSDTARYDFGAVSEDAKNSVQTLIDTVQSGGRVGLISAMNDATGEVVDVLVVAYGDKTKSVSLLPIAVIPRVGDLSQHYTCSGSPRPVA